MGTLHHQPEKPMRPWMGVSEMGMGALAMVAMARHGPFSAREHDENPLELVIFHPFSDEVLALTLW